MPLSLNNGTQSAYMQSLSAQAIAALLMQMNRDLRRDEAQGLAQAIIGIAQHGIPERVALQRAAEAAARRDGYVTLGGALDPAALQRYRQIAAAAIIGFLGHLSDLPSRRFSYFDDPMELP